jgi:hypothetical protein
MSDGVALDTVLAVSPNVRTMPLGDELTVFDATTGRALALNRTAADIFALVDGTCAVGEISAVLARRHSLDVATIEGDVRSATESLLAQGALTTVASPPA